MKLEALVGAEITEALEIIPGITRLTAQYLDADNVELYVLGNGFSSDAGQILDAHEYTAFLQDQLRASLKVGSKVGIKPATGKSKSKRNEPLTPANPAGQMDYKPAASEGDLAGAELANANS